MGFLNENVFNRAFIWKGYLVYKILNFCKPKSGPTKVLNIYKLYNFVSSVRYQGVPPRCT